MRKENVRCPMCGTMNYDVDLDATDGWTKCRLCKAVTCSIQNTKIIQSSQKGKPHKCSSCTYHQNQ